MIELYNLGIKEEDIYNMLELNPDIKDITCNDVKDKIDILTKINCDNNDIITIFSSNSLVLTKANEDIIKLINKLKDIGFNSLNTLFEANPYILNLDAYEIDNYIKLRLNNETLEEIVNDLEGNPALFLEI